MTESKIKYPDQTDFLNECDALSVKLYGKSSIYLTECPDICVGELADAFANDLSPEESLNLLIEFDEKDQPKNVAELLNKYIRSLGKTDVHYALYEPENDAIDIVCFIELSMTAKVMEMEGMGAEYRLQYFDKLLTCLARYSDESGEDISHDINDNDIQLIKEAYREHIVAIELMAAKYKIKIDTIDRDTINT